MVLAFVIGLLTGTVRSAVSVLFATLGEVITERAGVINLGVEGCMLVGACGGFIVGVETDNTLLAIAVGTLLGGLVSLIHAYLTISRGANQVASGLALMFFCLGLTALIGAPYVSKNVTGLNPVPLPLLSNVPYLGPILFRHDLLTYTAYLLCPAIWFVLFRTRWGLIVRAIGEDAKVPFAAGWRVTPVQYSAVFVGGLLGGLGGAHLSLAYTHGWVEGMTNGRGFIAVALVIFSTWHPIRALGGALVFGGATALQLQSQGLGVPVSPFILTMTPYVLTIVVLLLSGRNQRLAMPRSLRLSFQGS
ncbi:MAG TPA: ABC transporter permease [Chloroflexota bacterium]